MAITTTNGGGDDSVVSGTTNLAGVSNVGNVASIKKNKNNSNTNSSIAKSIARQRLMRLYGKAADEERPCPSISENDSYNNEVAEETNENYFETASCNLNNCVCDQLRYNNQANSCNNNNNNGVVNKDGLTRPGRMLKPPQPSASPNLSAKPVNDATTTTTTTTVVQLKQETKNKKYNQMLENANNNNKNKKCKLPQESQHLKSSSAKIGEEMLTSGASSSSATTSSERPLMNNEQGSNVSELEMSKEDHFSDHREQYNSNPNNQAEEEEETTTNVELKISEIAQNENNNAKIECSTTSFNHLLHHHHHQATIINEELNFNKSDAVVEIVNVSVVTLDGSIKANTTSQTSSTSQCGVGVMCANLAPETLSLPNSLELSSSIKDDHAFYSHEHQNDQQEKQVVSAPPPPPLSTNSLLVCPVHNKAANVANNQTIHWNAPKMTHKETMESKRERKAAKTLAIITG